MLSHCDCPDKSASIIFGWMTMKEILYFYSQIQSLNSVPSTLLIFCELLQSFVNVPIQWTLKKCGLIFLCVCLELLSCF